MLKSQEAQSEDSAPLRSAHVFFGYPICQEGVVAAFSAAFAPGYVTGILRATLTGDTDWGGSTDDGKTTNLGVRDLGLISYSTSHKRLSQENITDRSELPHP